MAFSQPIGPGALPPGQTADPELTAIASTTSTADALPYFTGPGLATTTPFTAVARTLLSATDRAGQQTVLGLVPGVNVAPVRYIINATTVVAYTPVLTDENRLVTLNNALPVLVTIPNQVDVNFPIGSSVSFLWLGVGRPAFIGDTSVTINSWNGLAIAGRYGIVTAVKRAPDRWILTGDTAPVSQAKG